MEILGVVSVPWWIFYPLLVVVSIYIYSSYKHGLFKRLGIRSNKIRVFFGDFPKLAKQGIVQLDIDNVRNNGKVFGTFLGNAPALMIVDPDMIREIFVKRFANFSERAGGKVPKFWTRAVIHATGDDWKFLRGVLSPTFSSGKMKKMSPIIQACIDNCVDILNEKSTGSTPVDFLDIFNSLTLDVICRAAFGIEVNSQSNTENALVKNVKKVMDVKIARNPIFLLPLFFPEMRSVLNLFNIEYFDKAALAYIKESIKSVIEDRKKEPSSEHKDLLQLMIDAHSDVGDEDADVETEEPDMTCPQARRRALTDDEILSNAVFFLMAGFDTTAASLTWVAYTLATNSECQERLREEVLRDVGMEKPTYDAVFKLQYLDMVVSETLRLYPPVPRHNREAKDSTEVFGYRIPKGLLVTVPVYGLHRTAEYWPEPDKFDPDRFSPENKGKIVPFTYCPFGIGPRNCIGMRMAQMEIKMAVVALMQHFRLSPSDKTVIPPKFHRGGFVKPEGGLWLNLNKL